MFESVELSLKVIGNPSVRCTASAMRTIGESPGVEPAGRSPTRSLTTVISAGVRQRSFSSAAAASMAFWNLASSAASDAGADDRMSTSIQPRTGMEFTEVPPPTRPTLNVVFGSPGT